MPLARKIRDNAQASTGNRIEGLTIETAGESIIISGITDDPYLRQLAGHSALQASNEEAIEQAGGQERDAKYIYSRPIINNISVIPVPKK